MTADDAVDSHADAHRAHATRARVCLIDCPLDTVVVQRGHGLPHSCDMAHARKATRKPRDIAAARGRPGAGAALPAYGPKPSQNSASALASQAKPVCRSYAPRSLGEGGNLSGICGRSTSPGLPSRSTSASTGAKSTPIELGAR